MKKFANLIIISLLPLLLLQSNTLHTDTPPDTPVTDTTTVKEKDTTNYVFQNDILLEQKINRVISLNSKKVSPKNMAICVYDISTDTYVYKKNEKALMAPASCMKLLTALTALDRLGTSYSFCDSLFINGNIDESGTFRGTVILKMDDDPLFWDFNQWAKAVQSRGIKRIEGNIIMHLARRDTLCAHPNAKPWDIKYFKLPLMLKGERFIKRTFINTLAVRGIRVKENTIDYDTPVLNEYWTGVAKENEGDNAFDLNLMLQNIAERKALHGAECIASTENPLLKVLAPMLIYSSNMKAESIFYHLDNVYSNIWQRHSQYGKTPHEVEKFLKDRLGVDSRKCGYVIDDGSGLSPMNRLDADLLIKLLLWAYNDHEKRELLIRELLASPGIKGRCGSLKARMYSGYTRGRIFCKTGTLVTIGGSSLAGFAHGLNGHWYAFAIINRNTSVWNARDFQDRICREIIR